MPRRTLVALATCTCLFAAGCGGPDLKVGSAAPSPVSSWGPGAPPGTEEDAVDFADPSGGAVRVAATLSAQGQLLVTTWGSSSCPLLPESVEADGPVVVVATRQFTVFGGNECTTDVSPMTSSVPLPAGITGADGLRVVIDGTSVQARKP